jgi:hypothetical protein
MTEPEWVSCTDPQEMLKGLPGPVSDRKLRLFACACCRRLWGKLKDERSKEAVEVAEHYADGLADRKDLTRARSEARFAGLAPLRGRGFSWDGPGFVAWCTVRETVRAGAREAADTSLWYASSRLVEGTWIGGRDILQERARQVAVIRCVFGNPFRPVPPTRAWLTPDVLTLAEAAYEQRSLPAGTLARARLAVLADALEEAGCTRQEVLSHLRSRGPHVRGCWAVDLLLGRG